MSKFKVGDIVCAPNPHGVRIGGEVELIVGKVTTQFYPVPKNIVIVRARHFNFRCPIETVKHWDQYQNLKTLKEYLELEE